jgi:penicillin amidase
MAGTSPEEKQNSDVRKRPRLTPRTVAKIVGVLFVVFIAVPAVFLYGLLTGSKATLDGTISSKGIGASVTITRDSLGVPTIVASTRADLAYGTGFVHAQDRFFQMDLSRRLASGELSEIFGRLALEQDRSARLFRFRHAAQAVLSQATPEQVAIIKAYASGVNAGLASLRSRPWEYIVLQATPAPWKPEDVVLMPYAMWWDLQYSGFAREKLRRAIDMKLAGPECAGGWKCALEFFYPRGTSWDSPNSASGTVEPRTVRLPTPDELDLRKRGPGASDTSVRSGAQGRGDRAPFDIEWGDSAIPERASAVGSNGWVVGGSLTEGGGALVTSDMHLGLRVPTVWYRARLQLKPAGASAPTLDLNGVTLPGAHVLVAGSNGHIAWGFTNAYGDWVDLTFSPCVAVDDTELRTSDGTIALSTVNEHIRVKGEKVQSLLPVRSGPEGLLYEADPSVGRCWFARWIATVPSATNFNIAALETVSTVAQAVELAPSIGIPHQNFMVGDAEGHIAWSIVGRIPNTADAKLRLTGEAPWTTPGTHPSLIDPSAARVWTANARSIDDATAESDIGGDEAQLGADYDLGARAKQIHDDLVAIKTPAKPADMLAIQLDDRAVFLSRWRDLLIGLLDDEALRNHPQRAELKRLVTSWNPRATPDSVGYRLVRAFRSQTEAAVWHMMLDSLEIDAPGAPAPSQFEGALWELVTQQPPHLLAASYPSWRDFLLAQADATVVSLTTANDANGGAPCATLEECTWGSRRPVRVRHPLAGALPVVARFLNMPPVDVPGDHDMPRVQDGAFGASERFAVVPGREAEGYLHIAGGQSGHPLSPYYRAGFREWAEGKPLPFLPGAAEHTLTLEPAAP